VTLGAADPFLRWDWVQRHGDDIRMATREHVELTLLAVAIGLAISLPLGVLAWRRRWLRGPTFFVTGTVYTIPSLALFAFLVPYTGLSRTTSLIGLVGYTLLILVRNIVTGLDGVPEDVREAAAGMGYGNTRLLLRVQLPLALPAIFAGLRVATVTTIGLVTVTALIGQGGLGRLILEGLVRDFRTPLTVGLALSVALAIAAETALRVAERLLTPWSRSRRAE
jgi:osmoprotectant transport system permease protein